MEYIEEVRNEVMDYLRSAKLIGERWPECPDVEGVMDDVLASYMADGVKEFAQYPVASLGWAMYVGMAMANHWDKDWTDWSKQADCYEALRAPRGFDCMDEYILEEVLKLAGKKRATVEEAVYECAHRVHSRLLHAGFEPGTVDAFRAYAQSLQLLYLVGMAVELHRLGYKMTKFAE